MAFEHVSLAFDDKVILKDVSFTLNSGHTKIILGASGAGKSITLKIILGLLKPDAGAVWVNGHRVDQLTEDAMMAVRADLGMVFQEGALFDSLTVRENVGYRLYEESDQPLEAVDRRVQEVLGIRRLVRVHRSHAVGVVRRSAPPGGDCPGDDVETEDHSRMTRPRPASIRSPRQRWTTRSSS